MAIIESAGVKKNGAVVDTEGRLQVFAAQEGEDRHINQTSGKAWSVPYALTTTGADAYVAYVKNTGTANLHVTDDRVTNTGVASVVQYEHVSGVAVGDIPVVPISRRLGDPVELQATTLEAAAGTGITGLTFEGLIYPKMVKANDESHLRTSSNILIPPGQAMAIKVVTSGAILRGVISVVEVAVEVGAR